MTSNASDSSSADNAPASSRIQESIALHGGKSYHYLFKRDGSAGAKVGPPKLVRVEAYEPKEEEELEARKRNANPFDKYIWFDDGSKVKIMLENDRIDESTQDALEAEISSTAISLLLQLTDGDHKKDYKLSLVNLNAEIVPEESKISVKKGKISVALKKKDAAKHWYQLFKKMGDIAL